MEFIVTKPDKYLPHNDYGNLVDDNGNVVATGFRWHFEESVETDSCGKLRMCLDSSR